MRCIACNALLTDEEMKEVNSVGEPEDFCKACLCSADQINTEHDDFWKGEENE